jgi:hypothetical protein
MRSKAPGGGAGAGAGAAGGSGGGAGAQQWPGQRAPELGAGGAYAAAGVAARGAKALLAAARAHVVAEAEAASHAADALAEGAGAEGTGAACVAPAAQAAWTRGQARVAELRPRTPDADLLAFLQAWAAQPAWAAALHVVPAPPAGGGAAPAAGAPPPRTPAVQGLAVCWSSDQAFFLELSPHHLARALPAGAPAPTLRAALAAALAAPAPRKLLHGCAEALPLLTELGVSPLPPARPPLK